MEKTAFAYQKLSERYAGSELCVNRCELIKNDDNVINDDGNNADAQAPYLRLEYVEGKTLEEILDERLANDDVEGFHILFDEYLRRISVGENEKIADYDLIFANFIVADSDDNERYDIENNDWYVHNTWNVIDCEWSFERIIETKQIAFRAVYCYLLENEKRNKLNLDLILQRLNLDQSEAEQYRREEMEFQKYVTGKGMSMAQIREAIGRQVYTIQDFCEVQARTGHEDRIQIYEDTGRGFVEEQSFFLDETMSEQVHVTAEGVTELAVSISGGRSALRVDPCSDFCMIYIRGIMWNTTPISLKGKQVQTNGFKIGENVYVFPTTDPNITISLAGMPGQESNLLQMTMEVTRLPEETVNHIRKRGLL